MRLQLGRMMFNPHRPPTYEVTLYMFKLMCCFMTHLLYIDCEIRSYDVEGLT